MSLYHRISHMKDTPVVKVGDWIKRGQLIGYCGSTGASSGPHAHYDIRNSLTTPPSHIEYVYGWSRSRVAARYIDPTPYIKNGCPMDNTFPRSGWNYLQWARNYYHTGTDINSVNDFGKPLYSPVEGRVVYVQGTSWIKDRWGRLVKKNWGSGWGNMVVIEQSPNFDITKV